MNLARSIAFVVSAWTTPGHAAGGHFAVDDATILDRGQCQIETWWQRADHAGSLLHLGPACRVGPVELAANADRIAPRDNDTRTLIGPQIKWAAPVDDRISVGFLASAEWQTAPPNDAGATLYAALSVRVASSLLAHVNIGRDWFREAGSRPHDGVALEWQAAPAWAIIGERFRQAGGDFARLGVHWQQSAALGFDLSRARGLGSTAESAWTVGVTWAFDAPLAAAGSR